MKIKLFKLPWWVGVIVVLVIALALRLPHFGSFPIGLNRDEAALGYNAYSLLKSGIDEHGKSWPISFTSFGDQKLPLYIYTLIPFIAAGGLSATMVRLPSLLAGLVVIIATGGSVYELLKTWKIAEKTWASWLAMFLVAISPWAIHFSRVAYEAHLALALFLTGTWLLLKGLHETNNKIQRWWLVGAAASLSLTLLTYHTYHIFLPLFLLSVAVIFWPQLKKFDRPGLIGGIIIGGLVAAILFTGGVFKSDVTKSGGTAALTTEKMEDSYVYHRAGFPAALAPLASITANKYIEPLDLLSKNMIEVVSPDFLFVKGSEHSDNNPNQLPNLPLWFAPFILLGIAWLWEKRKTPEAKLLLAWAVASLIAPALTITPEHTVRATPLFPILTILAAFGLLWSWQLFANTKLKQGIFIFLIAFFSLNTIVRTQVEYMFWSPKKDALSDHERWDILANAIQKYQPISDEVITQEPSSSPYIWYLFDSKYDPKQLQQMISYYPVDKENFQHVSQIGNVYFQTIQWDDIEARAQTQQLTLIFTPEQVPPEKHTDPRYTLLETLNDRFGNKAYEVWKIGNHK